LDLTDAGLADRVTAATAGLDVGLLVYNAGAANRMPTFLDDPVEDSIGRIELNCVGPVVLARLLGPPMRERGRGGIVLVGSLSCLAGAARVVVYSAAKAFGVNLAEGLWAELRPHGVDVCNAVLGSVRTPSAARMGVEPDPERDMEPDDVAAEIVANIGNGPTYVVGEANRAMAAAFWTVDRGEAVTMISEATTAYADRLPTV
jgi:short-subunit dehydrogenase